MTNFVIQSNLKRLIDRRVKAGKYATPQDVLAAAVLTLDQQEQFGDFAAGELDSLLAEGERSIYEKGAIDGDKAYQARRRKRARLGKKQG